jgi:hypothetical protein
MSNLWVFGDNSSSIFGKTKERRYFYYNRFRNGIFPKTWSELLSEKLNLNLRNYAIGGQSNYDIFEWFCKMSTSIQKDDVVIIGWSNIENFRVVNQSNGEFITSRPAAIKYTNEYGFLSGINLTTINELHNNRINEAWGGEILNWENLINLLAKTIEFKIYYWTFDKKIHKPYYIGGNTSDLCEHLKTLGAETITIETNKELNDNHFGEKGQQVQYEYFLNYLYNYNINNNHE